MFEYLNDNIVITNYDISSEKIPETFNGFKIIQVSDLHEKLFGKNQEILVDMIKDQGPNIIVMTGDILDNQNFDNAMMLINRCKNLCPVYFTEGNHEFRAKTKVDFYMKMLEYGVHIIDNSKELITRGEKSITISGCSIHTINSSDKDILLTLKKIGNINFNKNQFNILLTHRPEFINIFGNYDIDLIFSGHAHGGQWRFFNKGIYAPGQGLFPKYTAGIHSYKNTKEIISRGLGNAVKIPRINNFPELVTCTLHSL